MIAIIDYGMANLRSVYNALQATGADGHVTANPDDLKKADAIVLPGVGAFGDGMRNLRQAGFVEAMEEEVLHKGKPFLGICLGMQLLATTGLEHGEHAGLNWVPGVVDRIPVPQKDPALRVPHVGWNDVRFLQGDGLYAGLGETQAFYFVHSFTYFPEQWEVVSGTCSYGLDLVASIEADNISATQFHPEKSHKVGLAVLNNWYSKVMACSKSA